MEEKQVSKDICGWLSVINTAGVIVALSRNIDKMPIFTCNGIDATIFLYVFIGQISFCYTMLSALIAVN
jgi:hypothetical protein